MKGLLFYDKDLGKGGPDGYLMHAQKWCVEYAGSKYHISSELLGSPGYASDPPRKKVQVELCDESCGTRTQIPDDVWEQVEKIIIEDVS